MMVEKISLLDKFDMLIDGYYFYSDYANEIRKALTRYEDIFRIIAEDSLARDGWEMIEAAFRYNEEGSRDY